MSTCMYQRKNNSMDRISKNIISAIAIIVMIGGCVYSGRVEYNDDVLSGMSAEKYRYIHDCLGDCASQEDVVKEYIINQKYYDSIQDNGKE